MARDENHRYLPGLFFSQFTDYPLDPSYNDPCHLAFTRALTIIYTTTLLSLLTHIQLNLIGTRKYIESVRQLARDTRRAESLTNSFSIGGLLFGNGLAEGEEGEAAPWGSNSDVDGLGTLTEETERKFLTMSWWLLHVGWRDIGERVKEAVGSVFQRFVVFISAFADLYPNLTTMDASNHTFASDSVSLKANLGLQDVERLISDVRKRVEFEDESDGVETAGGRRIK